MVQVVSEETKRLAQARALEAARAQEELQRRENQLKATRATNIQQLQKKQLAIQDTSLARQRVSQQRQEIQRIADLPTVEQAQRDFREKQERAIETARELYDRGYGVGFAPDELSKKYLKELYGTGGYIQTLPQGPTAAEVAANASLAPELRGLPAGSVQSIESGRGLLTPIDQPQFTPVQFQSQLGGPPQGIVYKHQTLLGETTDLFNQARQEFRRGDIPGSIRTSSQIFGTFGEKGLQKSKAFLIEKGIIGRESTAAGVFDIGDRQTVSDVSLGGFFAPAFVTGTSASIATESDYVFDAVTGRYVKKSDMSKLIQERLMGMLRSGIDEIKDSKTGQVVNVREVTRTLVDRNRNNPENLKRLRDLYKAQGRESLFDDIVAQEIGPISQAPVKSPTTTLRPVKGEIDNIPNIKGSSVLTSVVDKPEKSLFFGTGQYERTDTTAVNIPGVKSNNNLVSNNLDSLSSAQSPFFNQRELNKQNIRPATLSIQPLTQPSALSQPTALANPSKISPRQSSPPFNVFNFIQRSKQEQSFSTPQSTFFGNPPRQTPRITPKETPLFGVPNLPELSKRLKRIGIKRRGENSVVPEIKRFGKWITAGKPTSYDAALKRATKVTDETLGASFRLRKKDSNEILPIKNLPGGFDFSKRNKFVAVEKRNRRISTNSELREIMKIKKVVGGTRFI